VNKYKIKAWPISQDKWEAQYVNPPEAGIGSLVLTGKPERLGQFFTTENEANEYTLKYLVSELEIPRDRIDVLHS
jgi:hypothetical protein